MPSSRAFSSFHLFSSCFSWSIWSSLDLIRKFVRKFYFNRSECSNKLSRDPILLFTASSRVWHFWESWGLISFFFSETAFSTCCSSEYGTSMIANIHPISRKIDKSVITPQNIIWGISTHQWWECLVFHTTFGLR